MDPFVNEDLPEADYHADRNPWDSPTLSSHLAQILDRQSPAHAHAAHPRLGGNGRSFESSREFDFGVLVHRLVLGKGPEIVSVTADDWRGKPAQERRREARAEGKLPILQRDHERVWDAKQAVLARLHDLGIDLSGGSEVSVFWEEQSASSPTGLTRCRARMDHIIATERHATTLDLKSCMSAHPDACARHVNGYGYAIQRAAYVSAIETVRPELAGRVDFVFVFVELEQPFVVTPVRLSPAFCEIGERRWRRAVELWADCLARDRWPGYVDSITTLEAPEWAIAKDTERSLMEDAAE